MGNESWSLMIIDKELFHKYDRQLFLIKIERPVHSVIINSYCNWDSIRGIIFKGCQYDVSDYLRNKIIKRKAR